MAEWKLVSKHEFGLFNFVASFRFNYGCGSFLLLGGGLFAVILLPLGAWSAGLLLGVPAFLLGAFLLAWPIGRWFGRVRWVRVYEEGLRWLQGGGEGRQVWEDVLSVSQFDQDILVNEARSDWTRMTDLTLRFADGTSVSFNHFLDGYDRLAREVQKATGERRYAQASADFDAGGAQFGPVTVSRQGIQVGERSFTWG